ncbi:MAG: 50S ribosomal protein L5 [Dehalococcoidia bacterium]
MPSGNRVATKGKKKPAKAKEEGRNGYQPRLKVRYREEIVPALIQEFGYTNPMQAPRVNKIVLNIGLGEALENAKAVESATKDLEAITGQHPVITRAKKSIANFRVRQGMVVGLMVTLRGTRMYEFLDRLINASLPRIRDFRGLSADSFDGRGNYSIGVKEQTLFPEIEFGQMDRLRGLQITIVTSAKTNDEARRLLALFGMPFTRSR